MEHRYFPRHVENFNVTLKNKMGETIDTRVLDVSREGLQVSMNDSSISPGIIVEVLMPEDKRSLFGLCSLRAFVAHAGAGGLGLWLIDEAKKFDQVLEEN